MFIIRRLGSILRGRATPFQLAAACILGSVLGFMPGLFQAPGLMLALTILLAIINANLILAALAGGLAYLASLAAAPLAFELGYFLLDGPTQPLFRAAINTPVLALFGFQNYTATGGLVLGLVFGVAAAVFVVGVVLAFRRKMAGLEEGSERYQRFTSKGWVKALSWILLGGGKGKKVTYAQLSHKKIGNPIRILGVVFAALLLGLIYITYAFFNEPIVTAIVKNGLERANGATVDVQRADLDLRTGRLVVEGLALADASKADESGRIDVDLLRVARMEAKSSVADLLRARIAVDKAVLSGATSGDRRAIPGRVIRRPEPPPPPPPPVGEEKTLDDYLAEAEKWKARLEQVRDWLETIDQARAKDERAPTEPGERRETLRERLEREAAEKGYRALRAGHLVEGAPTFLIREAIAEELKIAERPGEQFQVIARNLSTQPWLVDEPPSVTVRAARGDLDADIVLGASARIPANHTLRFEYRNLATDAIVGQLARAVRVGGQPPVQGGTMDLSLAGILGPGPVRWLDLPLNVTLHNSTIAVPRAGQTTVETLTLPIGLRGPISNPRILVDERRLADALVAAGKSEIAGKLRGEAEKAVDKAADKALDKAGDALKDKVPTDGLKDLIPGRRQPR